MRRLSTLLVLCGIFSAAMGVLALAGWLTDVPLLASFYIDKIPMAPSTAGLFIAYGMALVLKGATPYNAKLQVPGQVLAALGSLIATVLFTLSLLNIQLNAETLGLHFTQSFTGITVGHMSRVSALFFVACGLCIFLGNPFYAKSLWRGIAAFALACLLAAASSVFLLGYFLGTPLLYATAIIPPAFSTVLVFFVLGSTLTAANFRWTTRRKEEHETGTEKNRRWGLVFGSSIILILVFGFMLYQYNEKTFVREIENQLVMISGLKVDQLVQYRKERLADASILGNNPVISALVGDYLNNPANQDTKYQLALWLNKYKTVYQYDSAFLLDAHGTILIPSQANLEKHFDEFSARAAAIFNSDNAIFLDFYREPGDGKIYLAVATPIFDKLNDNKALGIIVLRINPETYLYPFIQDWPIPSLTAETLLVRREGSSALFLNDLKFKKDVALALQYPLDKASSPAVQAVLGKQGIFSGQDYRSVSVLAALQQIPDSPWFIVAKVDVSEAYKPLRDKALLMLLVSGALVFAAALSLALIGRNQKLRFYREKYNAQKAVQAANLFLESLIHNASGPIIVWNPEYRITHFNQAFELLSGHKAVEIIGHSLDPSYSPALTEESLVSIAQIYSNKHSGPLKLDIQNVNGTIRTVLWTSAAIYDPAGTTLVATIAQGQDITELQRNEERLNLALEEKEILMRELFHRTRNNMQVIMAILAFEKDISSDESVKSIVQQTSDRIMSMSIVHKKLYESQDLSSIDLKTYLEELLCVLMSERYFSGDRISVKTNVEPILMLIDTAVPFGLVLHEIISNAFRHAFADDRRGEVSITISQGEGRRIELEVTDNGVGLPEGFDFKNTKSLGFPLLSMLVEQQLGGTLRFRSSGGLSCHASFIDANLIKRV